MLCPNCKVKLVASERQGVDIDYCPQCHGVWLECGAMDKIIERALDEFTDGDHYTMVERETRLAYLERNRPLHLGVYDTPA